MKDQTREEPRIVAAAERQMHSWVLNQQIAARQPDAARAGPAHRPQFGRFITISREAGAGGSEIGALVGRKLEWEVLDKNLLDRVADRYALSRPMLEIVDETKGNWAHDVLGTWLDRRIVPHEKYVVRLNQVILAAARRGNVVFVGRGAQFMLPRGQGLAVRVIASEKFRVERIRQLFGMTEAVARRFVTETDRGRREFVAQFFRRDLADPHLYDLVINSERLGFVAAADCIAAAYQR